MSVTTSILGASGYSGQETLDRVLAHPELELVALGSDSLAGQGASVLDPRLNGNVPAFVSNDAAIAAGAELVFCCLDHERAALLDAAPDVVVVDLSGAHRLAEPSLYDQWYGFEHPRPESLGEWSYAIPELFPPTGPLIANPGCYATAVLLALAPLTGRGRGERRRRRRQVRRLRRGADAESVVTRGVSARERHAVQGRLAPARPRDRAGARLPRLLRPAPAARAPGPDRDVLRAVRARTCASCSRPRTRRRLR